MSKQAELFHVRNSDWTITETAPGIFTFASVDETKKIEGLTGKCLVAANAVISELDRYLTEVNPA